MRIVSLSSSVNTHAQQQRIEHVLCLQRITSVQNRYQHKTQVAWNPWRPIVFAVLFGLLMLFAVIAGCTVVTGRFPRAAATFTWLLWIMTAIFMILGAGQCLHHRTMTHSPAPGLPQGIVILSISVCITIFVSPSLR